MKEEDSFYIYTNSIKSAIVHMMTLRKLSRKAVFSS